jgi:hypothetical protein
MPHSAPVRSVAASPLTVCMIVVTGHLHCDQRAATHMLVRQRHWLNQQVTVHCTESGDGGRAAHNLHGGKRTCAGALWHALDVCTVTGRSGAQASGSGELLLSGSLAARGTPTMDLGCATSNRGSGYPTTEPVLHSSTLHPQIGFQRQMHVSGALWGLGILQTEPVLKKIAQDGLTCQHVQHEMSGLLQLANGAWPEGLLHPRHAVCAFLFRTADPSNEQPISL